MNHEPTLEPIMSNCKFLYPRKGSTRFYQGSKECCKSCGRGTGSGFKVLVDLVPNCCGSEVFVSVHKRF